MTAVAPGDEAAQRGLDGSRPRFKVAHLIQTNRGGHVLVVDGSRLFDVDDATFASMAAAVDDEGVTEILRELGLTAERPRIDDTPPAHTSVRALSLAIAQKCNLGCTYCYAQEGGFGATPQNMPLETALASVDLRADRV